MPVSIGFQHSKETKYKLRLKRLGNKNPFFGKHHSLETKRKIAETLKRKGVNQNQNHGQWKGDNVGYSALHAWVKRHLNKSDLCQNCKKRPSHDLANISQEYKRDLDDWEWLCRKCHMKSDGRLNDFYKIAKKKGETPWNKGKKNPQFSGENHPRWKGGITKDSKKYQHEYYLRKKNLENPNEAKILTI